MSYMQIFMSSWCIKKLNKNWCLFNPLQLKSVLWCESSVSQIFNHTKRLQNGCGEGKNVSDTFFFFFLQQNDKLLAILHRICNCNSITILLFILLKVADSCYLYFFYVSWTAQFLRCTLAGLSCCPWCQNVGLTAAKIQRDTVIAAYVPRAGDL